MTYKTFIIDMFNLTYKKRANLFDSKRIANNVIDFIEEEIKQRLEPDGKIYLAFDPLPKSDLGMSKNFKFSTDRKKISKDYKSNRTHEPIILEALKLLKKYYTYRGPDYRIVISNHMEADDFVEGLVNLESTGMIALVSNDMDWARYISDRVHMINEGFDNPYTRNAFFEEKGYFPTVTAITLDKAIFGDPADCIEPVLTIKNRIYKDSTKFIKALIKELSKANTTLEQVYDVMNNSKKLELMEKTEKSHIEDILTLISVSDDALDAFKNNLRLIKCRCDDVTKYIQYHPDNPSYNTLIETTLGRNPSSKQKFHFGTIS